MTCRRKTLTCGCCGDYFQTWPEYVDQGNDKGFGTCADCQAWQQEITNRELDQLALKIERALNAENAVKFQAMDADTRRQFAAKAIADGLVEFTITGPRP